MFYIRFELGQGENESVCYIARKVSAVTISLLSDSRDFELGRLSLSVHSEGRVSSIGLD